jgi:hypothetical protein
MFISKIIDNKPYTTNQKPKKQWHEENNNNVKNLVPKIEK